MLTSILLTIAVSLLLAGMVVGLALSLTTLSKRKVAPAIILICFAVGLVSILVIGYLLVLWLAYNVDYNTYSSFLSLVGLTPDFQEPLWFNFLWNQSWPVSATIAGVSMKLTTTGATVVGILYKSVVFVKSKL